MTNKIDDLLPHAIKEYDQTLERYVRLNSRATSQIGFVGVIIAIFGFSTQSLTWGPSTGIQIAGFVVLLVSIIISIVNLYTKKFYRPDMKEYFEDEGNELDKKCLLEQYLESTEKLDIQNNTKAGFLNVSYVMTLIGLSISSLAIICNMFTVVGTK